MEYLVDLAGTVAGDVWTTLVHNWPYLLASVLVASVVQVYMDQERLAAWLHRRTWVAILGAVALGALTPFCSCGTTAIVLGAMASSVPWAPIVAFMTSSPLTSPEEYVLSVGLFGPAFATTFFLAAIAVGLIGGGAAWWLERRGLLVGQARTATPAAAGGTDQATDQPVPAGNPGGTRSLTVIDKPTTTITAQPTQLRKFGGALLANSRRLAIYFLGFATLGYLVIRILPTPLITDWLGTGNPIWSVPLAAILGIPVYLNTDASLPLVASLRHGGIAPGAAIAFLITGAGTSLGAISGMLVIARWRIVALIISTLLVTAIATGWLTNLWPLDETTPIMSRRNERCAEQGINTIRREAATSGRHHQYDPRARRLVGTFPQAFARPTHRNRAPALHTGRTRGRILDVAMLRPRSGGGTTSRRQRTTSASGRSPRAWEVSLVVEGVDDVQPRGRPRRP